MGTATFLKEVTDEEWVDDTIFREYAFRLDPPICGFADDEDGEPPEHSTVVASILTKVGEDVALPDSDVSVVSVLAADDETFKVLYSRPLLSGDCVETVFREAGGYVLVTWKPGYFPGFAFIAVRQPRPEVVEPEQMLFQRDGSSIQLEKYQEIQ